MFSIGKRALKGAAAVATAAALSISAQPVVASAQGGTVSYTKATADRKVAETPLSDGRLIVSVWSDSMQIEVPNIVQRPANNDNNSPVYYLPNGAGGGEDAATWQAQSNIKEFMGTKNVWSVTPIGGAFSYYTDWIKHDPNVQTRFARETKRPMKFETFLTKELPALFESAYNTRRVRAINSFSMTATSVLSLAQNNPGLYKAVVSLSGCAETSTPAGHEFIRIVTGVRGGANLDNMWGPYPGKGWTDNDPVVNAWKLKDQTPALWIATGNGLPGPHDNLANPRLQKAGSIGLANQIIVGGIIEAAANYCTANLARRLAELKIPAHFDFKPYGTHSWGYWEDDLHRSWPMVANALGVAV